MIFKEKKIPLSKASELILSTGLDIPRDVEYTVGIYSKNELIGTGSISRNVLKGIAVLPEYQGQNITEKIITHLAVKCFENSLTNFFIFTKNSEKEKFIDLGFSLVGSGDNNAVLLEYDSNGIIRFENNLKQLSSPFNKNNSCLVMNCNPFTKGHLYLIEKAAAESDHVFILVVQEDKSIFPFDVRMDLIEKGTKHLKNISVIPGGDYTISSATFPSYFIKENQHTESFARLDLDIFINHTSKALSVNKRYIGEEPYCPVTSIYNQCIKSILPESGIEVVEIARLKNSDEIISASKVRSLIREGKVEETERFLPPATYSFLVSDKAQNIIESIKSTNTRH